MDRTAQGLVLVLLGLMVVVMGDTAAGISVMGIGAMVIIAEHYHQHHVRLVEHEREVAKWELMDKMRREKEAKERQEQEWLDQRRRDKGV
jgi:hypothetical protein